MSTPLFISESVPIEIRNIIKAVQPGCPARYQDFEGTIEFVSDEYITLCVSKKPNEDPHAKTPWIKCCVVIFEADWDDLELDPAYFQHKKAYRGKTNDHPGNEMLPAMEKR